MSKPYIAHGSQFLLDFNLNFKNLFTHMIFSMKRGKGRNTLNFQVNDGKRLFLFWKYSYRFLAGSDFHTCFAPNHSGLDTPRGK